jgi:hypothetical protein
VRYEEWSDDAGTVFLPDDGKKARQLAITLVGEPKLVWWVEADSWVDACQTQHEHHGWEPYVPLNLPTEAPDG